LPSYGIRTSPKAPTTAHTLDILSALRAVSLDATPDFHLRYTDKNEIVLSSYYEKTRPSQPVAA